jgi:cytoskeletal protein CcmA (bactofilin family)
VLRIDGRCEGPIHHTATVTIGPHGAVAGAICAAVILVEGEISGNLTATKLLRVAASAKVVGDLCAPRIAVARGARLRGRITMRQGLKPPSDLDESAVDSLLSGAQTA